MPRLIAVMFAVMLVSAACRPDAETPTQTPTDAPVPTGTESPPTPDRAPDLYISRVMVNMVGYDGTTCVTEYGPLYPIVCVRNGGDADAPAFTLAGGSLSWDVTGLAVGEEVCVEGDGPDSTGEFVADSGHVIDESDETNNFGFAITATPPPTCTPAYLSGTGDKDRDPDGVHVLDGPSVGG